MERFVQNLVLTQAYLEPWHVQNLRNIWNPFKHLYDAAFIQNPNMFRTLACFETDIFRTLSNIYGEVFYSEHLSRAYLDSRYIQNLSIFRTQEFHIENL